MTQAFSPQKVHSVIPKGPRDYFVYAVTSASLASGATANLNLQISADSDFWWTGLTCFTASANASQTYSTRLLPLMTLQITDTGSGRQLFNVAVPVPTVCGDGAHINRLIHPRFFARSTTIQVQLVNFDAAVTYVNTYLSFIGFKIFGLVRRSV
jgi:hypothetical protein